MLDVLIVNYNTSQLLKPMFAALDSATENINSKYWVVDNASRDNSVDVLRREFPHVGLEVNATNIGFGRANNQLLKNVLGQYVLLLNTDAFVSADTVKKTLHYMQSHPDCGLLGVKLVGRDGALQPSCRYFPTPWNTFLSRTGLSKYLPKTQMVDNQDWNPNVEQECDWVPGCYYLIRREVLDDVGLFDPRYFLYCEEVDHCKRVKKAGWKVIYFPDTTVIHIGGESAKSDAALSAAGKQISDLQLESELLYFRKHHGLSGVLQHMILTTGGGIYQLLKSLIRRKGWRVARSNLYHFLQTLALCWRTRFGARATR